MFSRSLCCNALKSVLAIGVLTISTLLFGSTTTFAASADPDPSFSDDGLLIHLQHAFDSEFGADKIIVLNGITSQPDGKIIVVGEVDSTTGDGNFSSFIARFQSNGALDTSFNGTGFRNHNIDSLRDAAFEVLVQANGKILVGGQTVSNSTAPYNGNIYVVRYHSDGSTDTDFGVGGGILINRTGSDESLLGMALRNDGSIVLGGASNRDGEIDSFFARLNKDGDLDSSFGGGDGVVVHALATGMTDNASGIDVYPNGKIAFTGSRGGGTAANTLVGRLNADGSLDTTFAGGVGYKAITNLNTDLRDFGDELLVLPNGELLLAITLDTVTSNRASLAVLKLSSNGEIDSSFGTAGLTTVAPEAGTRISIFNANELLREPNGSILVVGAQAQMDADESGAFISDTAKAVVARLHADGSFDTDFDNDDGIIRQTFGVTSVYPRATTIQGDGKLLMAGRARIAVSPSESYTSYMVARLSGDAIQADTTPEPISFADSSDVEPGSVQTSAAISVSGISNGVLIPVRISNGEYSLNGAAYTSDASWAIDGDEINLRHTASNLGSSTITTTLTIGGVASQFNGNNVLGTAESAEFSSTTIAVDTAPDAFALTEQTDVALDSWIQSNTVTIAGINYQTPISISNGEYSIGCSGSFTSTAGFVTVGNSVCLRQRSAAAANTAKISVLTIGDVSGEFRTTTAATVDITPETFAFIDRTAVTRLATITSNTITVTGINAPVSISMTGSGGYSIGCTSTFINTPSTISNGQTVCLRHLASNTYNSTVTSTLTVGGVADSFTSTTGAAPTQSGGGGGGGGNSSFGLIALLAMLAGAGRKRWH